MRPANWESFIHLLKWRMRNDNDNVVVIYGDEGDGKSTLAHLITTSLDPHFDTDAGLIFDWDDWDDMFDIDHGQRVYWLDETINLAFNRDWNLSQNKRFAQVFRQNRYLCNTYIMCLPVFKELDKVFRESRTRYKIDVLRRGRAEIKYRVKNRHTEQVFFRPAFPIDYPIPDDDVWREYKKIERGKKRATLAVRTGKRDDAFNLEVNV